MSQRYLVWDFSQTGCPSCHPFNSAKALKDHRNLMLILMAIFSRRTLVSYQNVSIYKKVDKNGSNSSSSICMVLIFTCMKWLGFLLDSFARQHLWQIGLDYLHGTGHGVGSFLNVHEGLLSSCLASTFGFVIVHRTRCKFLAFVCIYQYI